MTHSKTGVIAAIRRSSRDRRHLAGMPAGGRQSKHSRRPSRAQSSRSGRRLGRAAPAARHRRGDGRGDAAHLVLADPQLQPRFLDRDLRPRRPADRPGRARADPCRRAALRRQGDDRVLPRRHPQGRRLPAQRPLSRRQPSARPDRLCAGLRRRRAALLVDQPGAPERHRRRHARRLQRLGHRHLAGRHPHHAA